MRMKNYRDDLGGIHRRHEELRNTYKIYRWKTSREETTCED
jgi:hypothetical protein